MLKTVVSILVLALSATTSFAADKMLADRQLLERSGKVRSMPYHNASESGSHLAVSLVCHGSYEKSQPVPTRMTSIRTTLTH